MSHFFSEVRWFFLGDRPPFSSQKSAMGRARWPGGMALVSWRSPFRLGMWAIAVASLIICLHSLGFPLAAVAQVDEPIETAPVEIDGQELFVLTSFDKKTAQERADELSANLEALVEAGIQPDLFVEENIIKIDQQSLSAFVVEEESESESDSEPESDSESESEEEPSPFLTVTKTDARVAGNQKSPEQQARAWRNLLENSLAKAIEERSPDFLQRAMLLALAVVGVTALLSWWIQRLKNRILPHPLQELQHFLSSQQPSSEDAQISLTSILTSLGLGVLQVSLWIMAGLYVINLFPLTRDRSYVVFRALMDSLFSPMLPLGDDTYSITDLIVLIAVFSGVVLGATVVANLLRTRILRMAGLSSGSQEAIAAITRYVLIAIGAIVVLQVWGLDLSSLTLLASALGVGIGFGFQNIAKDFGSGLVLLFERPVQVGDFVEVDEFMGTVDRIGARSTSVKTLDQVSIIVPNSYFLENQVINWSHENPLSRIALPVGVSYNSDPEQVRKILLQAAEDHPGIVRLPRPQVFFYGFGDSALDFKLMFWIVEPNRQPLIKSDLYFKIFALFRKNDIEIPFPQRDLHIRSGQLPIDLNSPPPESPVTPSNGTEGNGNN